MRPCATACTALRTSLGSPPIISSILRIATSSRDKIATAITTHKLSCHCAVDQKRAFTSLKPIPVPTTQPQCGVLRAIESFSSIEPSACFCVHVYSTNLPD
ncbi:Uncharacterised protein [Vibrio cholerae]|nr:Uncharacterised protein [Vibrio cholerae]CSI25816.1 Uncharacterised protein [Vibrio cholerae]